MKNDGTEFQDKFQEALVWIQEHEKAVWHRFVDTKAARNLVAEQPGDFMLLTQGVAHLFELKSFQSFQSFQSTPGIKDGRTAVYHKGSRLAEALRSPTGLRQVAQARKWERGGGRAWFALCEFQSTPRKKSGEKGSIAQPKEGWVSVYALWDVTEGAGTGQDAKPRYQCSLTGLRAMLWCLAESKIEFNKREEP